MCTGLEPVVLASIIGGGTAAASSVVSARQAGKMPAAPAPQQPTKSPTLLPGARKRRGAYGPASPEALTSPLTGGTTLLGQ